MFSLGEDWIVTLRAADWTFVWPDGSVVRWIAEERPNLAVERPAAICHVTGLPVAAPLDTRSTVAAAIKPTFG